MKKLLGISLVAIMSVSAANAEIASKAYVDTQTGQLSTLTTTAKGNLVAAINEVKESAGGDVTELDSRLDTLEGAASVDGSVAQKIATALEAYTTTGADTNYVATVTTSGEGNVVSAVSNNANGTVTVTKGITALTATDIANMQTTTNLSSNIATDTGSTTKYPSVAAVEAAITAAEYDDSALDARLDAIEGSDYATSGITSALVGKITTNETAISTINSSAPMTSGITSTKVGQYDALVTSASNYGDIVTHDADEFASAAQGAKADTAVQTVSSTGTGNVVTAVSANTNGTVTVTSGITAIPQPSGECTDCVLHYNGTAYSWEEITR